MPAPRSTGPSSPPSLCQALSEDGEACHRQLLREHYKLCQPHHREYKRLYEDYKRAERCYQTAKVLDEGAGIEKKREIITLGRSTLDLRNKVNRRFFSLSSDNRGHVQRILKLENEIKQWESDLELVGEPPVDVPPARNESAGTPPQTALRSLLSPDIPMSALDHLPRDHPFVVMKQEYAVFIDEMVRRLYETAPSLNDSGATITDTDGIRREPDEGDHVIRYLLRELIVLKADADTLAKASRMTSIDAFLRQCLVNELEDYIKFFERLGRDDTFRILRDSVCDYLLPAGKSSLIILGGAIATDDSQRSMTLQGWDILYAAFGNFVGWQNIELLCVRFEDALLVKQLIVVQRYSEASDKALQWHAPNDDVSQENTLAVLQGFLAVTKGFQDPVPLVKTENGVTMEREARCYLAGRMGKNDPMAKSLIRELANRVAKFILVVYDMEGHEYGPRKVVKQNAEIPECWITRMRSATRLAEPGRQDWEIEWSLGNVIQDLEMVWRLRDRNMARDYYEFVIIERMPGTKFRILDEVSDALMQLDGDKDPREIVAQAIKQSIPADQVSQWVEAVSVHNTPVTTPAPPNIQYEDNRVRAWDLAESTPGYIYLLGKQPYTVAETRLVTRIVADMESRNLITLLNTYETPLTCPIVRQGTDGQSDVFFDYSSVIPIKQGGNIFDSPDANPSAYSLHAFAQAFQITHPEAVFAKGTVHAHYCAWPMPAIRLGAYGVPNFRTVEGHLYRWNVHPFDAPLSLQSWQLYVHKTFNSTLNFVRIVQTTLVVAAPSVDDASEAWKQLMAKAEKHSVKLSVPMPHLWTGDIESLDLKSLWKGIRPIAMKNAAKRDGIESMPPTPTTQNCSVQ